MSPIANVDLAWMRMDEPVNRMTVTALLSFHRPLDFERLGAVVEQRLLRFRRFHQRVVEPGGLRRPAWEDDPHFDLSSHLRRIALPPPADEACLRRLVGTLMASPLPRQRPLWEFLVIDNYGHGGAVLARLHHAIADGAALMQVLLSLTDERPGDGGRRVYGPLAAAGRESVVSRLGTASSRWGTARELAGWLYRRGVDAAVHPANLLELAAAAGAVATTAADLVLRSTDPPTVLRGELGIAKRAAWSEAVPLTEIKAIGRVTGGTVNDVLLAAMTGALRRYLQHRGEDVAGLDLHAAVPVNLRSPADLERLGNRFGLVFLALPIGIADPLERLFELERRMEELKAQGQAEVTFGILGILGLTSDRLQRAFVELIGAKTTLVTTNVPGPRRRIYLAGSPLRSMMFWVPQTGRVGLGISILSYAGEVRLGLASDAGLVADPERIAAAFHDEIAALAELEQQARAA